MSIETRTRRTAHLPPTPLTPTEGRSPEGGALQMAQPVIVREAENRGVEREEDPHQETENGCTADEVSSENNVSAGQSHADARGSLGSRASVSETDAVSTLSDAPVDYAELDVPGADPSDDVEPLDVPSTTEHIDAARAFFGTQKACESAEQVKRARTQSRVFSVMQYRHHPETGEPMYSQEQLDAGLDKLGERAHRWAFIWHDSDRLVEVDDGTLEFRCVGVKGLHVHMVLWFDGDDRPTIRTISDTFTIPSARVRVPKEVAAQQGIDEHKGHGAAEKAFWDFAEYLTHESRGKDAIQGIVQPGRFYLVDKEQPGHPGKYQYGRGRVVANVDFSAELDRHMAGRASAAEGSTSIRARKLKLRRAVMDGMTLAEAREADRDAYADDLPRLRALADEYAQINRADPTAGLGESWSKSLVLIGGEAGTGKGVLADAIGDELKSLAGQAGRTWSLVQPPGRNALEAVGDAELVHHDDMRFDALPSYDETLRYADPHRATEAYKRHTRSEQVIAPRVTMVSTTETPTSLGLSLKARKGSEQLAITATTGRFPPVDIDEFLRRIGWVVEVRLLPDTRAKLDQLTDARERIAVISAEMVVEVQRVRMSDADRRTEFVHSRGGERLGQIATQHRLEPAAVVKGAVEAARYLATSIMTERNADLAEVLSAQVVFQRYLAEKVAVEQASADDREHQRAEAEAARHAEVEAEQRRTIERLEAERRWYLDQQRRRELCTCETYRHNDRDHGDECRVLSDEERQRRADARAKAAAAKVERLRANGGLLVEGGAA